MNVPRNFKNVHSVTKSLWIHITLYFYKAIFRANSPPLFYLFFSREDFFFLILDRVSPSREEAGFAVDEPPFEMHQSLGSCRSLIRIVKEASSLLLTSSYYKTTTFFRLSEVILPLNVDFFPPAAKLLKAKRRVDFYCITLFFFTTLFLFHHHLFRRWGNSMPRRSILANIMACQEVEESRW